MLGLQGLNQQVFLHSEFVVPLPDSIRFATTALTTLSCSISYNSNRRIEIASLDESPGRNAPRPPPVFTTHLCQQSVYARVSKNEFNKSRESPRAGQKQTFLKRLCPPPPPFVSWFDLIISILAGRAFFPPDWRGRVVPVAAVHPRFVGDTCLAFNYTSNQYKLLGVCFSVVEATSKFDKT